MQKRTDKKLAAAQLRYRYHHDRCVCATTTFRPGQWVYVYGPLFAETTTNRMEVDLYVKLLPRKLGT